MRTHFLRIAALTITCTFSLFSSEPVRSGDRLLALAREAKTPAQHAEVAKKYKVQAEEFTREAEKHEEEAQKLTRSMGPMRHKWPAMVPKGVHDAKDKALQARRAARQSYELAAHHRELAVEALASSDTPRRAASDGSGSPDAQ